MAVECETDKNASRKGNGFIETFPLETSQEMISTERLNEVMEWVIQLLMT